MPVTYQNGITVNTDTGAILGVGNLTGNGSGNYQNSSPVAAPSRPTIAVNNQQISGNDPNYDAYAAQNALNSGQKLSSSQIPIGGYVPGGDRTKLPTVGDNPEFNKDVYKAPSVIPANAITSKGSSEASSIIQQANKINQQQKEQLASSNVVLKNPGIAQANPGSSANQNFINALYKEQYNRDATAAELSKFVGRSVKDAANLILGSAKSPFFHAQIPGSNPEVPDTMKPPAPEVAKEDGTIDPVKLIGVIKKSIEDINKLIADEREAFDNSTNELGNQLGTVMPLIQGEQAYQERRKEIRLQRLVDEKTALVESGNLQLKAYEYSRQLRKDQQEALGTIIEMNLNNGVPIDKATAEKYAALTGMDAQFLEDSFNVAAVNSIKNKNIEQDSKMLAAGFQYIKTPAELTAAKKSGAQVVELAGRSYVKMQDTNNQSWSLETDASGNSFLLDRITGQQKPINSVTGNANSEMGGLTVTGANGSKFWPHGLDVVLEEPTVKYPFGDSGIVKSVVNSCKPGDKSCNDGFGNQVVVETSAGDQIIFSHLNSTTATLGQQVSKDIGLGIQGNTGNVYSESGGDGTHVDITMKNKQGGYYTPQQVSSILGVQKKNSYDAFAQEQIALSVMPVQTRNSDKEQQRALQGIRAGLKEGKSPYEIADTLTGYKINKPDAFSNEIRAKMSASANITAADYPEMARMINAGNKAGAINRLEKATMKGTDGATVEATAQYVWNLGPDLAKRAYELQNKLGIASGNWNNIQKKVLANPEYQKLQSDLQAYILDWRKQMAGTAVTETELKQMEGLIPKTTDNPVNLNQKIKSFAEMQMNLVNSRRKTYDLPTLSYDTLMDYNKRSSLYTNDPEGLR